MKIAFCLLNYFPYGGLQRDFMRIAKECVRRGHEVHVFTAHWEGEDEADFHIHVLPVCGHTNHTRARSFSEQVGLATAGGDFALVVGFNKMPHLDLYYAADVCYEARIKSSRGRLYRWLPRYRAWRALEEAVFASGGKTGILLLSPLQQTEYSACYGTEAGRFQLLPPGISRDRLAPANAAEIRAAKRQELGLVDHDRMLLMIGSGYQTKGVDRAITGLAALPESVQSRSHLYVVGKGDATPYQHQATKLGIEERVHIIGPSDDVPALLLAADLLLQPSYHENTGTVILEALAAGLPVLTTHACGYAHYVVEARAGLVLPAQFNQSMWNVELEHLLDPGTGLRRFGENGFKFAASADIYSLPERAVDLIEQRAKQHVLS